MNKLLLVFSIPSFFFAQIDSTDMNDGPIGIHIATVLEVVNEKKIKIFPMEALNGAPVIDIKPFN